MMKKQFGFLTVLSAAALLAIASPLAGTTLFPVSSVLAAETTGWIDEDGQWRFMESDGYYLTDSWKRIDGEWFYLDVYGYLATNTKVDEYYVDEEGKRVLNQWIVIENDEYWDYDAKDEYYYYFGRDGKSVVSRWQTIEENTYYFNDEGQMQTGLIEVDGDTYYLGDDRDGVRKHGWIQTENDDMDLDQDYVWHYFDSKGRMIMNEIDFKIDGNFYSFVDGILVTGWFQLPAVETAETATASDAVEASIASDDSVAGFQYYEEDGKRAAGWYEIEGAPGISEDTEIYYFFFKNGVPTYAAAGVQMFTINSQRYAFNTRGEMQTGLETITLDDGATGRAYFGEDGILKTGKQSIYNEDFDMEQIWLFSTEGSRRGLGVQGIRDNAIYFEGLRQDASSELRFEPVELDGVRYLVNASGVIQKSAASSTSQVQPDLGKGFKDVKDANETVWVVDVNGIIQ